MKALTTNDSERQTEDGPQVRRAERVSGSMPIGSQDVATNPLRGHQRGLFDLAVDPIWITDAQGVILARNAAAVDLAGGGDPERGQLLEEVIHEDDVAQLHAMIERAKHDVERVRMRIRARSGRSARGGMRASRSFDGGTILWTARIERGTFPVPDSLSATRRSVEQREESRDRELQVLLERAERSACAERIAREDAEGRERDGSWTMAIVSHGMRTVIEILERTYLLTLTDAPMGVAVAARLTSIQRDLAEDLQNVMRVADCQLRTGFVPFDPAESARFVAEAFARYDGRNGVRVEARCGHVDTVLGDENRVILALVNLVNVAVGLAAPREVVAIGAESAADVVSLSVSWKGEPLGVEQHEWDLTRMAIAGSAPDPDGMSCLVARQIVQLHRGRLRFARVDDQCSLVATFPKNATPSGRPPRLA